VAHRGDLQDIGTKQTAALHLGLARR